MDSFDIASSRILDTLQELLHEGLIADESGQGLVLAYLCLVEVADSQGQSKILPLYSDGRTTTLAGLTWYADKMIEANADFGVSPR